MKRFLLRSTFAAAAIAVAAVSGWAQSLNAEIPFTFRAGGAQLSPGAYSVTANAAGGHAYMVLRNEDTRQSIILAQYVLEDPPKAWKADGAPRLAFECAEQQCVLRQVWTGSAPSAYRFSGPKPAAEGLVHIAEIRLTPAKSE